MSRALEISVSGKNEIVSRIAADRYRSENDSKIVLLIFAGLGAPSGTIGRCSAFVWRAGAKARRQGIGVAEEYLAHIGDPLGASPGEALVLGSASWRERGCMDVWISVVAGT